MMYIYPCNFVECYRFWMSRFARPDIMVYRSITIYKIIIAQRESGNLLICSRATYISKRRAKVLLVCCATRFSLSYYRHSFSFLFELKIECSFKGSRLFQIRDKEKLSCFMCIFNQVDHEDLPLL